jgi:hypothetical protein
MSHTVAVNFDRLQVRRNGETLIVAGPPVPRELFKVILKDGSFAFNGDWMVEVHDRIYRAAVMVPDGGVMTNLKEGNGGQIGTPFIKPPVGVCCNGGRLTTVCLGCKQ